MTNSSERQQGYSNPGSLDCESGFLTTMLLHPSNCNAIIAAIGSCQCVERKSGTLLWYRNDYVRLKISA